MIALLVASALPVWFHAAVSPTVDDCARPAALFGASRIGGAEVVAPAHGMGDVEIVEGREASDRVALFVRVIRSFEPSRLYARPIGFGFDSLSYLQGGERRQVAAGDGSLPVHWHLNEAAQSRARLEAYVFVQGGRPVWHPAQSGLALALPQLLTGTRPVTLLVVSGLSARDDLPALQRAAEDWLAAAWQDLESACDF